ncbi:hypothetical protein MUK42_10862 [Musa troglodytarum]|uniref:Uncharacterized protein n=1 Tax=Musa troglodytarum TaxID=320322 RepID=A0A9E7F9B5_9LILI|nr:hypothetical protein MUK42_10862 [Musa troglodytarum]
MDGGSYLSVGKKALEKVLVTSGRRMEYGKESRLVTSPGLPRCCVDREILQGLRVPRWCSPLPHSDTPFPCHCQGSDCARCGMDKYGGNQGSKQMTGVPLAESKEQQFNSDLCRNLGIKIDKKAMGEIVSSLKH